MVALVASHAGAGGSAHTSITIWATPSPAVAFGGAAYGGSTPPSGAMITEQRDVDVSAAGGEVRIAGVAANLDPASVQLRSLTDPTGLTISEQRFVPGATTPDEILARHVGEQVTAVTPKGDVSGTLRAVDAQALVVEVGTGDQRHLQVLRRDGYVQDVRIAAGAAADKPMLVWRLAAKKPGKHTVEVTYRADGLSWTADYLAVLDEAARTLDFSAWATIRNATGAGFDNAELTLLTAAPVAPLHPAATPTRFVVPSAVRLGSGESVQVELMKPRTAAKARSVITFEAMADPSPNYQTYVNSDCSQLNATAPNTGRAEIAVELDVPQALPDGRVRLFKRKGERLDLVSEEPLRTTPGLARIRIAADTDIVGERHATSCNADERSHTVHEKVEVKLDNKSKQAADVVVREFLWRYPMWRIDPSDESPKGTRAGAQTQEYRVTVPAGGTKSVTYSVVYTW